jgi:hypothetical protein
MKRLLFFWMLAFLLCPISMFAQTTPVLKGRDFVVLQEVYNRNPNNDTTRLTINFKIENLSQLDSLFLRLGTASDLNNVASFQSKITSTSTDTSISMQGHSYSIRSNQGRFLISILKSQVAQTNAYSLWLKPNNSTAYVKLYAR